MSSSSSTSRRMSQLAAQISPDAAAVQAEAPVLFRNQFAAGIYTLNRPGKLNALNHDMVKLLQAQIQKWEDSELCSVIVGTGNKTFCAGGDVKTIATLIQDPETRAKAVEFFRDEFMLDYQLSQLRKPYVAIMDGITMGGGVGLSMHAPFRVATERTVFAMPETDIGYFTDVGATHFLSRLDGQLGTYLGLTSSRVMGREVFECGIATHFVPSRNVPLLLERLSRLEGANHGIVDGAIDEFYEHRTADDPPPKLVGPIREAIDFAFSPRNPVDILQKLQALIAGGGGVGGGTGLPATAAVEGWAKESETALQDRSPTSVAVTREALFLAREKSLKSAFETEMRLAEAYCTSLAADFVEGVSAKLTKPVRAPEWNPARLSDVDAGSVRALFNADGPLPAGFDLRGRPGTAGAAASGRHGLPREVDVERVVRKERLQRREIVEKLEKEYAGKQGVRQKVAEVLDRKTVVDGEGRTVWRGLP